MENNGWQFKESSKRSKRNHGDYRANFSLAGYRFLLAILYMLLAISGANLAFAIFTLIRTL